MAKGYESLSRRALIKLGEDYDADHDGELISYLTKNSDKYESIRPVEGIISRLDSIRDYTDSSIKHLVSDQADKMLNNIVETVSDLIGVK